MTRSLDGVPRGIPFFIVNLRSLSIDGTMRLYLVKGGSHACHGRNAYRQGGGRQVATVCRDSQEDAEEWRITRPQIWPSVARCPQRTDATFRETTRKAVSEQRSRITVLSVAHRLPTSFQPISNRRCVRYLVVILPYGKAKGKRWLEGIGTMSISHYSIQNQKNRRIGGYLG